MQDLPSREVPQYYLVSDCGPLTKALEKVSLCGKVSNRIESLKDGRSEREVWVLHHQLQQSHSLSTQCRPQL